MQSFIKTMATVTFMWATNVAMILLYAKYFIGD